MMRGDAEHADYSSLLVRLRELDRAGKGQSAEADRLRELMGDYWLSMSAAEREAARQAAEAAGAQPH